MLHSGLEIAKGNTDLSVRPHENQVSLSDLYANKVSLYAKSCNCLRGG